MQFTCIDRLSRRPPERRRLVSVALIKADAHAAKNADGTFSLGDAGSRFGSMSVSGHPRIGAKVTANTQVRISGLGTLYLHRVIHHPNSIEVRMIELVVTHPDQPARAADRKRHQGRRGRSVCSLRSAD